MDLTPWLPKITSPALVIGGDEDVMTPWDQGPNGCGQQGDLRGDPGAEKHVIRGAGHSNDLRLDARSTRGVVIDFFDATSRRGTGASRSAGEAAPS